MSQSGYVHVDVEEIVHETESAFLLRIDGEQVWCPKACVADSEDYTGGDKNTSLAITENFARDKGIEGS
jgi:hypothetical protein